MPYRALDLSAIKTYPVTRRANLASGSDHEHVVRQPPGNVPGRGQ
jgi:hypothetical protein